MHVPCACVRLLCALMLVLVLMLALIAILLMMLLTFGDEVDVVDFDVVAH